MCECTAHDPSQGCGVTRRAELRLCLKQHWTIPFIHRLMVGYTAAAQHCRTCCSCQPMAAGIVLAMNDSRDGQVRQPPSLLGPRPGDLCDLCSKLAMQDELKRWRGDRRPNLAELDDWRLGSGHLPAGRCNSRSRLRLWRSIGSTHLLVHKSRRAMGNGFPMHLVLGAWYIEAAYDRDEAQISPDIQIADRLSISVRVQYT